MAKIKFVRGATELQFEVSISYPSNDPIEKKQLVDRTAAGTLRVESYGVTVNTWELVFKDITETDYTGLRSFFDNEANGALNSFTYHDPDGNTHTVRILTPKLNFKPSTKNRYNGDLELEEV